MPSEASSPATAGGRWHFVLERLDRAERMEVADVEREIAEDRLSLLCIVRGLEALEQPSQVTLVTTSRYVARGLRYGLTTWRESDYTWESFGVQKPIRNSDLWRRVSGALDFHGVTCRLIQPSMEPDSRAAVAAGTAEADRSVAAATTANEVEPAAQAGIWTRPAPASEQSAGQAARAASVATPQRQLTAQLSWQVPSRLLDWCRHQVQPNSAAYGT